MRKRFIKVVNNPSASGNKNHYEEWALEVNGVGRAVVYPLWNGNGTVKVMIVGNDNKPVSDEIVEACELHISENMPIGCQLTVTTPTNLNIIINASIELKEGYELEDVKADFENSLNEYLNDCNVMNVANGLETRIINIEIDTDIPIISINFDGNDNRPNIKNRTICIIHEIQSKNWNKLFL